MFTQAQLKTAAVVFALLVVAEYLGFGPASIAAKINAGS